MTGIEILAGALAVKLITFVLNIDPMICVSGCS
jgi:hypothetical protein